MIISKSLENLVVPPPPPVAIPEPRKISVLFFIKQRTVAWNTGSEYSKGSYGLINSATFVSDMLNECGFESEVALVANKTEMDPIICQKSPDIVIVEAVWLAYDYLVGRNRRRKWIVRCHSEIPFFATEGVALSNFLAYGDLKNMFISCNSPKAITDFNVVARNNGTVLQNPITLLPNYYPIKENCNVDGKPVSEDVVNISCFGAIRPFKSHLLQAIAAMMYADEVGKKLRFHINASRIEGKGEPVLDALRAAFKNSRHELVEHPWFSHEEFTDMCKIMDLGLQVSLNETFNIVAADHVANGVPVVGSKEIPWLGSEYCADPCDSVDIKEKIKYTIGNGVKAQADKLRQYVQKSKDLWIYELTKIHNS